MSNSIDTIKTLRNPNFLKGTSRVFDLYGKLDEYKKQENADYEAIRGDWEEVGNVLSSAMSVHEKKQ